MYFTIGCGKNLITLSTPMRVLGGDTVKPSQYISHSIVWEWVPEIYMLKMETSNSDV